MPSPIYVLNGPSLNLLGTREPEVYGRATLADIERLTAEHARSHGLEVVFRQSNHEGVLIDWIQEAREKSCGIIMNPGAYTHTSLALYDALRAFDKPIIEVHLSNPQAREQFRRHSYVGMAATGSICGFRDTGYVLAVDAMAKLIGSGANERRRTN
jgi:3-dehydroquinate dehydratase-2